MSDVDQGETPGRATGPRKRKIRAVAKPAPNLSARATSVPSPRPRTRPHMDAVTAGVSGISIAEARKPQSRRHSVQSGASGKRPTEPAPEDKEERPGADYDVGYGKPPKEHRFKPGNPGGGRPKGAKSTDTLLREELDRRTVVRHNGCDRSLTKRQIATALVVNRPLETRDPRHLAHLMSEARRLYPEQSRDETRSSAEIASMDRDLIQTVFAAVGSLGAPNPAGSDPLMDLAAGNPLRPQKGSERGAWDEGDWQAVDEDIADDN